MKKLLYFAAATLMLAACNGKTATSTCADEACSSNGLAGSWYIATVSLNDSVHVHATDTIQQITFHPDSTFGIRTNCNSLGGTYILTNDTLRFENTLRTEMACPDMTFEETISQAIDGINKVVFENDSTARLCGDDENLFIELIRK